MPLAQNYIDDVSGTSLTKTTMDTESNIQQKFHMNLNHVSWQLKFYFFFPLSRTLIFIVSK